MHVDAVVYLNDVLYEQFSESEALQQLCAAATLPGVVQRVIGMPDIHTGFGLPIGGVMATHAESGIVSAGAVGMDINCGVRLIRTDIPCTAINKKTLRALMEAIEERIPTGIGKRSRHRELGKTEIEAILHQGVKPLLQLGYGWPTDQDCIEEAGEMPGADLKAVSLEAISRANQLATIGGGNHFIEIGQVAQIFDPELAANFGLKKGALTVLIHTGSRGFGHQICTDYSKKMLNAAARYGINLPNRGLASVPINSPEGQTYLKAMACAVNFAFANRQLITHDIREAFAHVFADSAESLGLQIVYDVAHNIAKFEEHHGQRLLIHRKGATRALPAGHQQNPRRYLATGHPAIVPGSMGTSSYVLVGTPLTAETFNSVNHGAGRILSRTAARKEISCEDFARSMGEILLNVRQYQELLDEAPAAYKNIDHVVDTLAEISLTKKVARLEPLAVIKGEGED
ncbi:MAG: RtcB family protein [Firmicutes bacterium]|nr:RtcB family protein [Bacillota bacterium]